MTRRAAFDTREDLLRHAGRVFAETGYERASMARIAGEAGVSKGTPYNYFDSKAALFTAYVQWECRTKLSLVFDGLSPDGDVATGLRGVAERILRVVFSSDVMAMHRIAVAEAAKFPELARIFYEAGPAVAIHQLSAWLAARSRAGELRMPDPEFAAEQFFALCKTRYVMLRELRLIDSIPPEGIRQVVDATVALFLAAYEVR